jgi:ribonuclease HI
MSLHVIGYCDGACKGNPGKGGWGAFIQFSTDPIVKLSACGGKVKTTNQEMELQAMLMCLKLISPESKYLSGPLELTVHSDSTYVLNGIIKGGKEGKVVKPKDVNGWMEAWIKNNGRRADNSAVKHFPLWLSIKSRIETLLAAGVKLNFVWVKGHSGVEGNERADALANEGAALQ